MKLMTRFSSAHRAWTLVGLAVCAASPAAGGQSDQDGVWSEPFELPLISIHAAMLPTGKVLLFGSENGVPGIHAWTLDPGSLALNSYPPPWDLLCSGHSFLPDGRLLVTGGESGKGKGHPGTPLAYIFNPYTLQWEDIPQMNGARWYPSSVALPDGRVLTMSGQDGNGNLNPLIETFHPLGPAWQVISQKQMELFPRLHVLPSGLVFKSGPEVLSEAFDPAGASWTPVATQNFFTRFEAPSVLIPPTTDRVLVTGGTPTDKVGKPTNTAEIIDLAEEAPSWQVTAPMDFPRKEHSAVILPDATVLIVGGSSTPGKIGQPVLIPEIFDPASETWRQVAPHQIPRMYHSTAVLLPDGRVLVAGGNFEPSGEIYSPGYVFRGPRPVITAAPGQITYGSSFNLSFTSTMALNTVALIRYSSMTHSTNFGQRYVRLAEGVAPGTISVAAPASANLAPPGFYMMFVVDDDGVPSEASTTQVLPLGDIDGDGFVAVSDLLGLLGAWGGCPQPCPPSCPADLDGDCQVSVTDLLILLANWS